MHKSQIMAILVFALSLFSLILIIIIYRKKIMPAVLAVWQWLGKLCRRWGRQFLRWSIGRFRKGLRFLAEKSTKSTIAYHDLAPINQADPDKTYSTSLKWAVENPNIHNIALTGPYGSGKSSILKTFQKINPNIKFLNLSLAAFKDFQEDDKIDQVIELSILKQIFYHVGHNKIPDSRFKRIKRQRKRNLLGRSFLLLIWLLTLIFLTKAEYYTKSPEWTGFYESYKTAVYYGILLAFLAGSFYFIYQIFTLYKTSKFNKVNITSGQLEFAPEAESSILNKHLDEILYFFEVTDFDVLIFEDLDRFKAPEIFTKLREINTLINNAQPVKRKISFIYALKDDIFQNEQRTKFFDFIIPVIPVINSSNSGELLINLVSDAGLKGLISDLYISDIALYIEDMRLLINILNEFLLYKTKLGNFKYDYEKLFSIILYKNLYPRDFAKLHRNKGLVYNFFSQKKDYIKNITQTLESDFNRQGIELEKLENSYINNIHDLRSVYIQRVGENIIDPFNGSFVFLDIRHTQSAIRQSDELFNTFKRTSNFVFSSNTYHNRSSGVSFSTVEKQVHPILTFDEREAHIKARLNNGINQCKEDLKKTKNEMSRLSSLTISEILENHNIEELDSDLSKHKLLSYLIRYGKIDEQYHTYISYFYAVNITKEDMDFVLSNKNGECLAFNFKLTRITELYKKLVTREFSQPPILNNSLINYFLSDEKTYSGPLELIFAQLSDQSKTSIDFIENYVEYGTEIPKFIKGIARVWKGFWDYVDIQSGFDEERKDLYLKLLFNYADTQGFVDNNGSGNLNTYITSKHDFLTYALGLESSYKLQEKLKKLETKFIRLTFNEDAATLFNFIYVNNLYTINQEMIKLMVDKKGNLQSIAELEIKNYSTILSSSAEKLKGYLKENIEEYISVVNLQMPLNTKEDEDVALQVLSEEIKDEYKEEFIKKQELRFLEITEVPESFWTLLFEEDRTCPIWSNLFNYFYFTENIVNEALAGYFNVEENYTTLGEVKFIPTEELTQGAFENFCTDLVNSTFIETEAISGVVDIFDFYLADLDFEDMERERLSMLIGKRAIAFSIDNFNNIKEAHDGLNIQLSEEFDKQFVKEKDELEFDANDFNLIVISKVFSEELKSDLLRKLTAAIVEQSTDLANNLLDYYQSHVLPEFEILIEVLRYSIRIEKKLDIINKNIAAFDNQKLTKILTVLGGAFKGIADKQRTSKVPKFYGAELFIDALDKVKDYISSYDVKEDYIKVNAKRK